MTIMSVSEVYSQASRPEREDDNSALGKDDFLTLLVAQLQYQDPLDPADSTEYTAQLAQFSSLEQLQNINDMLGDFEVYQTTSNNIQTSDFIGKTVTASGNRFGVQEGSADPIRFGLEDAADSVYVQIYDSSGSFVTDIQVGDMSAGEQEVIWNGRDANGTAMADGEYHFSIMAMHADGTGVSSTSYTTGLVTGIDYESGDTYLLINDHEVPISSVIRIEETERDPN